MTPWRTWPAWSTPEALMRRPPTRTELERLCVPPRDATCHATYRGQEKMPDCATMTDHVCIEGSTVLEGLLMTLFMIAMLMMYAVMPVRPLDNASVRVATFREVLALGPRDGRAPLGLTMIALASGRVTMLGLEMLLVSIVAWGRGLLRGGTTAANFVLLTSASSHHGIPLALTVSRGSIVAVAAHMDMARDGRRALEAASTSEVATEPESCGGLTAAPTFRFGRTRQRGSTSRAKVGPAAAASMQRLGTGWTTRRMPKLNMCAETKYGALELLAMEPLEFEGAARRLGPLLAMRFLQFVGMATCLGGRARGGGISAERLRASA